MEYGWDMALSYVQLMTCTFGWYEDSAVHKLTHFRAILFYRSTLRFFKKMDY